MTFVQAVPAAMVRDNGILAVWPLTLSVATTVNVKVPEALGVPAITPLDAVSVKPPGRLPLTDHVRPSLTGEGGSGKRGCIGNCLRAVWQSGRCNYRRDIMQITGNPTISAGCIGQFCTDGREQG